MRISYPVAPGDFSNAGKDYSTIKSLLKQLNISAKDVKRMVVAIYEAEVNMVAHSYGGQIVCTLEADKAIVEAIDTGPGIPDIDLAMTEGWSTATPEVREMGFGAGMGLPNIKKHTDDLAIETGKDRPTHINMLFRLEGATDGS